MSSNHKEKLGKKFNTPLSAEHRHASKCSISQDKVLRHTQNECEMNPLKIILVADEILQFSQ